MFEAYGQPEGRDAHLLSLTVANVNQRKLKLDKNYVKGITNKCNINAFQNTYSRLNIDNSSFRMLPRWYYITTSYGQHCWVVDGTAGSSTALSYFRSLYTLSHTLSRFLISHYIRLNFRTLANYSFPCSNTVVLPACGQQDQSKSQIQIQGNRGIFDWAALLYSFAVRTVSDWNQLPAVVVVEQENPAAFKAQLARCAPVRML